MKNRKNPMQEVIKKHHFRVSIFGSARIKKNDKWYKNVYDLAKLFGEKGFDVITGGGPGIMEAASCGHRAGDKKNVADAIGLTIQLPWEAEENKHLDIKKHFHHFSERLDQFMVLSHAVVVTPGGVGTCLELFYTWQLTQVKHICPIPIILISEMWDELIKWVKKYPLKEGLISPADMDNIFVAKDIDHAFKKILKVHEIYRKEGADYCINYKKYKID